MIFSRQRYEIKSTDREFLDYLPPVSALLGGLIFIAGTITAIMLYESPNGNYDIFEQFFSELGIRHNRQLENRMVYAPPYPDIFNITLYATGFLLIPFFLFSFRQFRNANRFLNTFLISATLTGIGSGLSMIGVGIFDMSFPDDPLWQTHAFWVAWLYLLIIYNSLFWTLMLLTARHLPYKKSKFIAFDYLLLILLMVLVAVNILDNVGIVAVEDLPLFSDYEYPIATYQKLIAYLFIFYYGLIVGGRLTKTKYDNTPVNASDSLSGTKYYCINCKAENPADSPFCTTCGVKLD